MSFPLLIGGAPSRYQINQSLRARAANNAGMSLVWGSGGSTTTATLSFWHKRARTGVQDALISWGTAGDYGGVRFNSSDQIEVYRFNGSFVYQQISAAVFRDPTAWRHIVVTFDTSNGTAASRLRIYINGVEITSWATNSQPGASSDTRMFVNGGNFSLGWASWLGVASDGYYADVRLIEGQALTQASFGRLNVTSNSWVPTNYASTYGTRGGYWPFNDATSTTTLAQDRSGNGNNFTSTPGISVTAGVTFDQMLDTPTNNFAVASQIDRGSGVTISNASLRISHPNGANDCARATVALPISGRWYWEGTVNAIGLGGNIGIATNGSVLSNSSTITGVLWQYTGYRSINSWANNGSYGGSGYTTNDVIGVAYDGINGEITFFKNGVSQGVCQTGLGATEYMPFFQGSNLVWDVNFGQRPFAYTPPSGFVALNTANLPTPVIPRGDDAFQTLLYTGNGAAQTITGLRFSPNLVWVKNRAGTARNHGVHDSVRGPNRVLSTSLSDAEYDATSPASNNAVTSFNADGFSLGQDALTAFSNQSGNTYAAWNWRRGAAYGFDIVTYTGNGANRTIAHGLNAVPHMMIGKRRSGAAANWTVYHRNANVSPATGCLLLNATNSFITGSFWNSTDPTSSVFSLGTDANLNANGETNVMYLWTSIPGFSLFGSYQGNGSADGPFVWCGFRPRFIMWKNASGTASSWNIMDAARSPTNVVDDNLFPNLSNAEVANDSAYAVDFTANGFKVRNTNTGFNESGQTIIFAAFAEHPFKFANAR